MRIQCDSEDRELSTQQSLNTSCCSVTTMTLIQLCGQAFVFLSFITSQEAGSWDLNLTLSDPVLSGCTKWRCSACRHEPCMEKWLEVPVMRLQRLIPDRDPLSTCPVCHHMLGWGRLAEIQAGREGQSMSGMVRCSGKVSQPRNGAASHRACPEVRLGQRWPCPGVAHVGGHGVVSLLWPGGMKAQLCL